jgi:hypothetical protein
MRFDGQQRVMRLSGAPLGSPAAKPVLTNRMREIFTYGSVGGAGSNPGPYPAHNAGRRTQFRFRGSRHRSGVCEFHRWT